MGNDKHNLCQKWEHMSLPPTRGLQSGQKDKPDQVFKEVAHCQRIHSSTLQTARWLRVLKFASQQKLCERSLPVGRAMLRRLSCIACHRKDQAPRPFWLKVQHNIWDVAASVRISRMLKLRTIAEAMHFCGAHGVGEVAEGGGRRSRPVPHRSWATLPIDL
jgi:hypothetical protein